MSHDHEAYIKRDIVNIIQSRLFELLRLETIDFRGKVALRLSDWLVEFRGTFEKTKRNEPRPLGQCHYQKVIVWISTDVTGLFVLTKEFQFSIRSFSDPEAWADAIEGSAFQLYRLVEPVLRHGFCSSCDKAYARDEEGGLLCACIEKAVQDAK